MPCKYHLSTNNGLLAYNVDRLCLAAYNDELMCKWNRAFPLFAIAFA